MKRRPVKDTGRGQRRGLNLQAFAGGSNLYCQSCAYYEQTFCDFHKKRIDRLADACSHYLGKGKL